MRNLLVLAVLAMVSPAWAIDWEPTPEPDFWPAYAYELLHSPYLWVSGVCAVIWVGIVAIERIRR